MKEVKPNYLSKEDSQIKPSQRIRFSQKIKNTLILDGFETNILDIYLKALETSCSVGTTNIPKRQIDLKRMIEEAQLYFIKRIQKFKMLIKINSPRDLFVYGDPLFFELILTILIGRSVYRVPKRGKIVILVRRANPNIEVIVHDNGYLLNETREILIKQSFSLYLTDSIFQKMCQDHNFIYESSRNHGVNISKLIIPETQPRSQMDDNVIHLF